MRLPTLSLACSAVLLLAALALPPGAAAGPYSVSACFGPENASWTEWEPTPGATAYTACPGGVVDVARPASGAGLVVRNVAGPGHARRGTTAAMRFDAPAGTAITGVDFDAQLIRSVGWEVGLHDATADRWLWCGTGCSTSGDQWVHSELRGLASQRIQALVRCVADRCIRGARHAVIALRHVRVWLEDGSPPRLGAVRGALAGGGWLRGVRDVAVDATDNTGIRLARVELDGQPIRDDARPCDATRPVPCADAAAGGVFDTRGWADGAHALRLGAQDAGGNWTWAERAVHVDNTAPAEPAVTLDGGAAWSVARTRRIRMPVPAGQAAPLVRARVRTCRTGAACADLAPALAVTGATASAAVAVPATPGEYSLRVALEDAAGNVGPSAPPVTLRFDDRPPGSPDVSAADRWLDGAKPLPLAAEGAPPASGIRGFRVRAGGRDTVVATSLPLDALPEGATPIEVRTVSGAGVESGSVRTLVRIDRSRPSIEASGVPAPDAWSRTPVRLGLRGRDQPGLSGVASVRWAIDGGAEAAAGGDEAAFDVAADGRHAVAYRALDGAGNASPPATATVNVDRTPPETVAFEAVDPADPTAVRVVVADATSGIAGGRIELRPAGGAWTAMRSTLEGGRLVGRLDDATLRAGAYELRAVAQDVAGNEAVGAARADGTPATVTLPLRARTRMIVRRSGRSLRAQLVAGERTLGARPVTLSQRLRGRTPWRRLCGRRMIVADARAPRAATTGTRASAPAGGTASCALQTDAAGRVEVQLPRGPSRTVRVAFAGDPLLLPARASANVRTPARVRMRATPEVVRAGGATRFAGRLLGGHIPRAGKLVELQARVGSGWRTFASVRTDRRGRFEHRHRFATTSAGQAFAVRVRVRKESAYPFQRTTTRPLVVRVI